MFEEKKYEVRYIKFIKKNLARCNIKVQKRCREWDVGNKWSLNTKYFKEKQILNRLRKKIL